MDILTKEALKTLIDNPAPPCLSLYQPTHRAHPERDQDPVRFKNLVKKLGASLEQEYTPEQVSEWLKPFHALSDDHRFWHHNSYGLAVLKSPNLFKVYRLHRPVDEIAIVAPNFHIKPLIRILQSTDRYHVLGVHRNGVQLYEGNRDMIEKVTLHSDIPRTMADALGHDFTTPRLTVGAYGNGASGHGMYHGHGGTKDAIDDETRRFFQHVDRAILKHHSQPTGLPVILAALPEHHHPFHAISHNPYLLEGGLDINPEVLSQDALREKAWHFIRPKYLNRLQQLIEKFEQAQAKAMGSDNLKDIAKVLVEGRLETLLIESERQIAGSIDFETGTVQYDDLLNPKIDDILDEFAELALKKGGEVIIVPAESMPTSSGAAATYRY